MSAHHRIVSALATLLSAASGATAQDAPLPIEQEAAYCLGASMARERRKNDCADYGTAGGRDHVWCEVGRALREAEDETRGQLNRYLSSRGYFAARGEPASSAIARAMRLGSADGNDCDAALSTGEGQAALARALDCLRNNRAQGGALCIKWELPSQCRGPMADCSALRLPF